ncbi:MAG TPA: outer membrane protein assembly factor BamE [Rhodopila sp.]|uniref:outer membrane protein assembly factor BamE n=1 Tax=Rhodopila sp. TaxID=2480087 RepID=UPI002C7ECAFA|nr:outer membrane protein assembly factor BamE [Rhodopila sp.]HVY15626.1 outer membrane protein assembly factor BamE [Rhodopila sp.]
MPTTLRHFLLVACLMLPACSWLAPPPQVRGNKVDPEQLKELTPGTSTKADVTAVIGSPTATATFNDNKWLYITELTQPRIGRTLGVVDQNVVELTFDGKGVLQQISDRPAKDALPVSVIARTTPSPGTEASFLQQLLGNIGRFVPAGTGGASTTVGGGAPGAP